MGTSHQGIHGGFTGKVGNVIGYQYRGKQVYRSMPTSVANPKTEKQRGNRERFSWVNRFLASQSQLVKLGFAAFSGNQTAFHAAVSYNMKHAANSDFSEAALSMTDLRISKGNLPPPSDLTVIFTAADQLTLHWTDHNLPLPAWHTDMLMVGLFDASKSQGLAYLNAAVRAEGTASLILPEAWLGRSISVFAFFLAVAGLSGSVGLDQVSDSVEGRVPHSDKP